MAKTVLLPHDLPSRANYLCHQDLPSNYMEDFSLMGFLVDDFKAAVEILKADGYQLIEREEGAELIIDFPDRLLEVQNLLLTNHIGCDFRDIADTLYQA